MIPQRSALALLLVAGCSGGGGDGFDAGPDAAADATGEAAAPIPKTLACTGAATSCLSGTLALKGFTAAPTATKVTLYRVFPRGDVTPAASTPVALDGTFAFSGLAAWADYFLQGEARFGDGASASALVTNVGSFAVPSSKASIPIVIRPVFLEALQQAPVGGSTLVAWASAHLFDPASGKEVTSGTVSLTVDGKSYDMPYGVNAGGEKSFNVNLPSATAGATSFTMTTSYPEQGAASATWALVGQPVAWSGAISSPTAAQAMSIPANEPLKVQWKAEPLASYTQTEVFLVQGSSFTQAYVSPSAVAPDVTTETVPAATFPSSGAYLLNEEYASATCPSSADGCVYNLSTAFLNLTVK